MEEYRNQKFNKTALTILYKVIPQNKLDECEVSVRKPPFEMKQKTNAAQSTPN